MPRVVDLICSAVGQFGQFGLLLVMSTRLYVGNLAYHTTEDTLRDAFAQDDRKVKKVSLMIDRDTGRSRGFAFVEMETEDDAKAAIEALDGAEVDGRPLRVNEAREKQAREGGDRPRGGGGGGGGGGRFRDRGGRDRDREW